MKRGFNLILKICLILFIMIGCDKDNSGIENNSRPSGDLLNDVIKRITDLEYSMLVGGDMGMSWSQQVGKGQYIDEAVNFIPRQSVIQNFWDTFYDDVIKESQEMYELASDEGNDNIRAIALVLEVYGVATLTDMYGDIPFSEALTTSTPTYDLQEDIYPELFEMLDTAISLFNTSDIIESDSDILYQGDAVKWLKFANSLKFRLLMRVSNVMPVGDKLQELINNNNLFQSNHDEAKRLFLGVYPDANPIYETITYGNRTEWKASEVIVDMLNSNNDQRITKMVALNSNNEYVGFPSTPLNLTSSIGELYLRSTAPAYLLSYSELEFLIAEAVFKGYVSSGSTEDHYNKAVTASFIANELESEAEEFLNNNPFENADSLEMIGNQKWISLYTQGLESWTEWRRTGFPILYVPLNNASLNQIPSRWNYPNNQSINNTANYNAAIQSQGEDNLTTQIWWMQ